MASECRIWWQQCRGQRAGRAFHTVFIERRSLFKACCKIMHSFSPCVLMNNRLQSMVCTADENPLYFKWMSNCYLYDWLLLVESIGTCTMDCCSYDRLLPIQLIAACTTDCCLYVWSPPIRFNAAFTIDWWLYDWWLRVQWSAACTIDCCLYNWLLPLQLIFCCVYDWWLIVVCRIDCCLNDWLVPLRLIATYTFCCCLNDSMLPSRLIAACTASGVHRSLLHSIISAYCISSASISIMSHQ